MMKSAYDISVLGDLLKDKGLDLAEDGAGHVYRAMKQWLKDSAALSENKFDDLVIPFIDQLDSVVLPQIDKIDGEKG